MPGRMAKGYGAMKPAKKVSKKAATRGAAARTQRRTTAARTQSRTTSARKQAMRRGR